MAPQTLWPYEPKRETLAKQLSLGRLVNHHSGQDLSVCNWSCLADQQSGPGDFAAAISVPTFFWTVGKNRDRQVGAGIL